MNNKGRSSMTVYFANRCRHIIILNIDDYYPVSLQPFETKPIYLKDSDTITVLVKRNCKSTKKSSIYHLVIETKYLFSSVSDGIVFSITREKIRFSPIASYDRLFLWSMNASCLSEFHKVVTEEEIKKKFNRTRLNDFIFDSFMSSPGLIVILLLVGISLTFIWGWHIAVIYFPLALVFIGSLNWLINKFWNTLGKVAFKMEDEKEAFYSYFNDEFIKSYYSNGARTPYMGNVEID